MLRRDKVHLTLQSQSHPRMRRKSFSWWKRILNTKTSVIEKKMPGVLGTRGGLLMALAWVAGIAVTPWLRWFVAGSLLLGLLFATVLHYRYSKAAGPPDILKSKD